MPEPPHNGLVLALLTALSSRSQAEAVILSARLRERCWPGGGDRTEPAAREWVRRWGPRGLPPVPLACSCRDGRCGVCN